ncbi:MAG TPA: ABC transporter permease [Acidimicrobiales bacterium]|nr:ABC transporter permease [Acidimicrobiales bacterium]
MTSKSRDFLRRIHRNGPAVALRALRARRRSEVGAISLEGTAPQMKWPSTPVRSIKPRRGWTLGELREFWEFRDLLIRFAARDVTLRYRQTLLGISWVVLQPLLTSAIFTLVFGRIAGLKSAGVPYFVFAFAGQVAWNAFNTILTRASSTLVVNQGLVSKIYFPRLLLPVSVMFAALIDASVALGMMLVLLFAYGIPLTWAFFTFPVWLLLVIVVAEGVGTMACGFMVRYRDVQFVMPVLIQLLLYATPVAYGLAAVPHGLKGILIWLKLNPLTGLFEGVRWSLLGPSHVHLSIPLSLYSAGSSLVIAIIGLLVFARMERNFADVL